jgi:hypothetical protein
MVEYPLPAVGVLAVPWVLASALGSTDLYVVLLVLSLLAVDGAFTLLMARRTAPADGSGATRPALWLWLAAAPVLGGVTLARFDLVAGVLAAVAVGLGRSHPRVAAAVLAAAVGIKLWPILLLPMLVAMTVRRREVVATTLAVGSVLAGVSVGVAGWGRLVSPLTYQTDRGLQIESVTATPAMVAWAGRPGRFSIAFSRFNAFEIDGPGTAASVQAAAGLTLAAVVVLGLLWWRALRLPGSLDPEGAVWLGLASVTAAVATSKVLSPQYLLWLLPLAAMGLSMAPTTAVRRWCIGLLVASALTHLVYPLMYGDLVVATAGTTLAMAALATRNALLLALLAVALTRSWTSTRCTDVPTQR